MQPNNGPGHVRRLEDVLPLVGQRITVHIVPEDAPKMKRRYHLLGADQQTGTVDIKQVRGNRDENQIPVAHLGLTPAGDGHWWNNWIEVPVEVSA